MLYDYLFTIINIYTLLRRLSAEWAAIKVIPCVLMIRAIRVICGCYSRFFVVAEVEHDAAGVVAAYPVIGTAHVRLCIQVFQIRCYIII